MAHTEFGFQVVRRFLSEIGAFGHPDFEPKLIGRGINVMISPLPRNKRPKNPYQPEGATSEEAPASRPEHERPQPKPVEVERGNGTDEQRQGGFSNNPFAQLEVK